jgi:archaellum component FlaC
MKTENDSILTKEKKTNEFTALIEDLENEIEELKNEAKTVAEKAGNFKKEKKNEVDNNSLTESVKEIQAQIEAEAQKYKKDMQEQQEGLKKLTDKHKELDQV